MVSTLSRAIAALALSGFAAAQTTSNCDPSTGKKCPADPAFGGEASFDFTTAKSLDDLNSFFVVDDGIKYNSKKILDFSGAGAKFTSFEEGNAPTIITKNYLFFGKVEVTLQAAPGAGIITAITLQSDDRDEIDYEFVGSHQNAAETNFYAKGADDYTHGKKLQVDFNPMTGMHTYALEWTPDFLTFSIDGKIVRTATPAEAGNGASYPQTPCQIRLGTWLGGGKDKQPGTVEWAGGHVDWSQGPFTAIYKSIKVTDYGGGNKGAKEYTYGDSSGTWKSIQVNGGTKADMPGKPGGDSGSVVQSSSVSVSSISIPASSATVSTTKGSITSASTPTGSAPTTVITSTSTKGPGGPTANTTVTTSKPTGASSTSPVPTGAAARTAGSAFGVLALSAMFALLL